jgi:geranylgeranylglycerol-phosphate geranylgeranyltransferase
VNRYLQLFRLGNCVISVFGLMLGALIATGTDIVDNWPQLGIAAGVVFAFVAGGNSLNDFIDRDIDKVAHPERPIPSGRMAPRTALHIAYLAFVSSLALALFLNPISIAIVVAAIALMVAYELRLKQEGLAGNLTISGLTGGLFLLGGAVVDGLEAVVAIAAMAFLATLGREIVKDVQDMEADLDRNTLPKRIGKRKAGALGSAAFLMAVGLSFQPYLANIFDETYLAVVLAADAIFIYCSVIHFSNPERGQRFAKLGMLVALIAFLLGGIS